jgi:acetyltransferase EpsM
MTEPFPVKLPLINPNETEAILAALFIQENQWVEQGESLCVLETTKSTFELTAETSGFVAGLRLRQGDLTRAGDLLCTLVQSKEEALEISSQELPQDSSHMETDVQQVLPGLRMTQPARRLALEQNLDMDSLPKDRLLTRDDIIKILSRSGKIQTGFYAGESQTFDPTAILLYGGGGHAKMLIDLIRVARIYAIVGILDDQMEKGAEVMGVRVLGGEEQLPRLFLEGIRLAVNAIGGIGNVVARISVFHKLLQDGFSLPPTIHPSAVVEPSATISSGAQVFARAYVGGDARLGFGAIASTGSILSHDCVLEEYAIVSPGAVLAGEVHIGAGALIGMGATINLRVSIGERARIGNNATINSDVPPKSIVQAGSVFP